MSLIFSLFSILLVSAGTSFVIFFNSDPYKSQFITYAIFYISSLLAIFSFIVLLIILYKKFVKKSDFFKIKKTIRRVFLLTFFLITIAFFSSIHVLSFVSAFSFLLAIFLLELFFVSKDREEKK